MLVKRSPRSLQSARVADGYVKKQYICAYGDCQEHTIRWVITGYDRGITSERQRFCCADHAIRWLSKFHGGSHEQERKSTVGP